MLMALRSPHACLKTVIAGLRVTNAAICLLSSFQSITKCILQSNGKFSLDLQPLSALPLLTHLDLQHGLFTGLEAAGHLTMLSILDAEAICRHDCSCVTSLVVLTLCVTKLIHFHRRNIAACSKLQSLTLTEACIGGDDEQNFSLLGQDRDKVPSGLSALTAFTSLKLNFDSAGVLDWATALSALQSFDITANEVNFPPSWNNMSNLTTFRVNSYSDSVNWDSSQPNAFFNFDWSKLVSLEELHLSNLILGETNMSGLASIRHLGTIELDNVRPVDVHTVSQIAMLAYKIGQQKRNIWFLCY